MKKLIRNSLVLGILCLVVYFGYKYSFFNNNSIFTSLMNNSQINELKHNPIQIEILNGCGEKGIAVLYTDFLRDNGYDVIDYKNANNFNYTNSKILFHNDNIESKELINLLNIDDENIDYIYNKNIFFDLTLIIGKDHKSLKSFEKVIKYINPFQ